MTSAPRGMPSMELTDQTKQEIIAEQEEVAPKPQEEMFQKPSMEIKPVESISKDEEVKQVEPKKGGGSPIKKPKKKLTEKQLEALRRGREKSIQTRKAQAEAKKQAKAKPVQKPEVEVVQPTPVQPPQPVQQSYIAPQIDYDKIINGVASRYDTMMRTREDREHKVAQDINLFEEKVRAEERNRVLDEIEKLQAQEELENQKKIAYNTISKPKPPQSQNPYLYAMNIGARNQFHRW